MRQFIVHRRSQCRCRGIMVGSTFYIMKDISIIEAKTISLLNVGVIVGTYLLLSYTRIPSPVVVAACLALGFFVPVT